MDRIDPLRGFRFRLDIENLAVAGFSDVAIAETVIAPVDAPLGTMAMMDVLLWTE